MEIKEIILTALIAGRPFFLIAGFCLIALVLWGQIKPMRVIYREWWNGDSDEPAGFAPFPFKDVA